MTEQELAGMIWNIKEIIRGVYDDTEVENVILPFTLLRRLGCGLQDRYEELYEQYRAFPDPDSIPVSIITTCSFK